MLNHTRHRRRLGREFGAWTPGQSLQVGAFWSSRDFDQFFKTARELFFFTAVVGLGFRTSLSLAGKEAVARH